MRKQLLLAGSLIWTWGYAAHAGEVVASCVEQTQAMRLTVLAEDALRGDKGAFERIEALAEQSLESPTDELAGLLLQRREPLEDWAEDADQMMSDVPLLVARIDEVRLFSVDQALSADIVGRIGALQAAAAGLEARAIYIKDVGLGTAGSLNRAHDQINLIKAEAEALLYEVKDQEGLALLGAVIELLMDMESAMERLQSTREIVFTVQDAINETRSTALPDAM